MEPLERTIVIDAPLERVWAVFTDLDGMPLRLDHVLSVERLGGPHFDVGTRWRHKEEIRPEVFMEPGSAASLRERSADPMIAETEAAVIGLEPMSFIVIEAKSPLGPSTTGYQFERQDDGAQTGVRALLQLKPAGLFGRLAALLFAKPILRSAARSAEMLLGEMKIACERQDPPTLRN